MKSLFEHIINHKKFLFSNLLTEGKLWQYPADTDTPIQQRLHTLVEQMKNIKV